MFELNLSNHISYVSHKPHISGEWRALGIQICEYFGVIFELIGKITGMYLKGMYIKIY